MYLGDLKRDPFRSSRSACHHQTPAFPFVWDRLAVSYFILQSTPLLIGLPQRDAGAEGDGHDSITRSRIDGHFDFVPSSEIPEGRDCRSVRASFPALVVEGYNQMISLTEFFLHFPFSLVSLLSPSKCLCLTGIGLVEPDFLGVLVQPIVLLLHGDLVRIGLLPLCA